MWDLRETLDPQVKMETQEFPDPRDQWDHQETEDLQELLGNRERWAHQVCPELKVLWERKETEDSPAAEVNQVNPGPPAKLDPRDCQVPQDNQAPWERPECQDPPASQEDRDQWDPRDLLDLEVTMDRRERRDITEMWVTRDLRGPLVSRESPGLVDMRDPREKVVLLDPQGLEDPQVSLENLDQWAQRDLQDQREREVSLELRERLVQLAPLDLLAHPAL